MALYHAQLEDLLRRAYSAEKAAAFAYIGHAKSVKSKEEKAAIKQIEIDEWNHRKEVLLLLNLYGLKPSRWYEWKFHILGRAISASCYVIGWFMPFYFAGDLESGNVCEYFRMKQYFNDLGITEHDEILYEMGIKEKEHEIYFYDQIKNHKWLPFFEKIFKWGKYKQKNDVDMSELKSVEESGIYCKKKD